MTTDFALSRDSVMTQLNVSKNLSLVIVLCQLDVRSNLCDSRLLLESAFRNHCRFLSYDMKGLCRCHVVSIKQPFWGGKSAVNFEYVGQ